MKISINITTYLFYSLLIILGYTNYLFIMILIMLTHEIGHIITIKLLGYKINKIEILPIGGSINTDINYNISSNHLFLISVSGIIMQSLIFLIIKDTNTNNYHIFKTLNESIILLNLLPIYPLDGYKIISSILERIVKYRINMKILNILSLIAIILLFIKTKNLYIFIIYFVINIQNIEKYHYIYNKFILERYLYPKKYKKVCKINTIKDVKKCRNNYIKCDKIYIEEGKYYKYKFQ